MSKTLDNVKTYGKKLGVISVMTMGNLVPLAVNTFAQTGVAHANTNVTAGSKKQGFDINVSHSELDKGVAEAKKAGVSITNKGSKTVVVDSKDADKAVAQIKEDYKKQLDEINAAKTKDAKQQSDWKKKHDSWQAKQDEYNKNGQNVNGVDPNKIQQKLTLGHELNANMKVSNVSSDMVSKSVSNKQFSTILSEGDLAAGFQSKSMCFLSAKKNNGVKGKVADIEYTNLSNSFYSGKGIKKIKVTLSNLGNNNAKEGLPSALRSAENRPNTPSLGIMQDPSETIWYLNSSGIDYSASYYDANNNKINVTKNSGYITVSSLNARYVDSNNKPAKKGKAAKVEGAKVLSGAKAQGLIGSSVTSHNGDLYSDVNNDNESVLPSSWIGWDRVNAKNSIIGAGLLNLSGGDIAIRFHTGSQTWRTMHDIWAAITTTIPKAVLPPEPVQPAHEKASFQLTNLIVKPSNHKDVTADGKTTSINGKEVKIDQVIDYPFTNSALPANRVDDIKSYVLRDNIPDGLTITDSNKKQAIKNLGTDWKLDIKGRQVTITAADSLLKKMNSDKGKVFNVPTPRLPVTVSKGGVTIKNHVDTIINGDIDVTSNTVVNPTEKADPSLIVKKVETSDGKLTDDVVNANIIDGKDVAFDIFSQVDNMNATNDVNYSDQLPKDAKVDVSKIKVYMSEDKVDASNMTKEKLTTLNYKKDVTKDFDIKFKGGKLTYTPKTGKAESYKGKQLKVRFMTSLATNKVDSELEHKGADYKWKNTASNGKDNSNTPDYHVTKDPSLIVKKVESSDGKYADDVANANIIDGKEVAFDIFGQIDNLDSTKDIDYSDQLPKDAKVDVSKIKVYMSEDKVDASNMTKEKLTTLNYKKDVTKDFDIKFKDGKLTYTPKVDKAKSYKGKQVKVRIMTSLPKDKVANELDSNGNKIVWNNTASNGKDKSNNVDYNTNKPKVKTEVKTEVITKMAQTGHKYSWFDKLVSKFAK